VPGSRADPKMQHEYAEVPPCQVLKFLWLKKKKKDADYFYKLKGS
jgi:hypothetical protein